MTTSELIERVTMRLNGTGNPSLPPEETLRAILELGKERDSVLNEKLSIQDELEQQTAKNDVLVSQKEDAEFRAQQAEDEAKEQKWIAHELGNFIRDIANSIYVGHEVPAANRVYDLNKGSLKKKRLNAYNFDSLQEAKYAYANVCKEKGIPFDEINMLPWLFDYAARP